MLVIKMENSKLSVDTPDSKMLFTADRDKKSIQDDRQHVKQSKSVKTGECDDCGYFSMKLVQIRTIYVRKWLCPNCIKKYGLSREV